jgi:hypothetical protein
MGLIGAMGVAADAQVSLPCDKHRRDPVRDAEKIAAGDNKRAKKAAKRARVAARHAARNAAPAGVEVGS